MCRFHPANRPSQLLHKDAGSGGNTCATPHEAWVSPFVHDSRHSRISQVAETGQRQLKTTPKRAQASDQKSSHHIGIEEHAFNAPCSRRWSSRGVSKRVLREAPLPRRPVTILLKILIAAGCSCVAY